MSYSLRKAQKYPLKIISFHSANMNISMRSHSNASKYKPVATGGGELLPATAAVAQRKEKLYDAVKLFCFRIFLCCKLFVQVLILCG